MANSKSVGLNIVIAGDPTGFSKAARKVEVDATGMSGKLKGMAVGAGAFLAGTAVVRWGNDAIKTYRSVGGELLKLKRLTGGSDEFTSGLYVGAQQSGVAFDKLAAAIAKVSGSADNKVVKEFGLELKNADGSAKPFDETLRTIMDKFAAMDNAGDKNRLARALFGRSGTDLLPLLNKGGEALDEFIAKADDLGLSLNSDDIKQATKNQRDFDLAVKAAGFSVGKVLLPSVTSFTTFAATNLPKVIGPIVTIGEAFNGLPGPIKGSVAALLLAGPAVKVFSLALTPVKMLFTTVAAGKQALGMFQLGLAGVTEKGSGAANALGGFVNKAGGLGVVLPAAAIGVGALALGFIAAQEAAARAKADIADLVASIRSGEDPVDAFNSKLNNTFAMASGGFNLEGQSGKEFRELLDFFKVDLDDLAKGLNGTEAEFDALIAKVSYDNPGVEDGGPLAKNLTRFREEAGAAKNTAADLEAGEKSLDLTNQDTADSTGKLAGATGGLTTALERAKKAVEDNVAKMEAVRDAQRSVADAHDARADALADEAEAVRAANGDSEEYRSAVQATEDAVRSITDAEEAETDAREARVDAIDAVRDAQQDLNETRVDARKRIDDMAVAARKAREAEKSDALGAREAAAAARAALADPTLTNLERERAQLDAEEAVAKAAESTRERTDAEREAAEAARRGVDGDEQVIDAAKRVADAKDAVADADEGIVDAERRVVEAHRTRDQAEQRQKQIIVDAKAAVEEATKRAQRAAEDEARAWGDLSTAQDGSTAGIITHMQALEMLRRTVAPGSAFHTDLTNYINLLRGSSTPVPFPGMPAGPLQGSGVPFPGMPPGLQGGGPRSAGTSVTVNQILQGTPAQQARSAADAATSKLDKWLGGM